MNDLGPVLSTHHGRFAAGGYFWYLAALMTVFGGWAVVSAPFTGDWMRAGNGVLAVGVAFLLVLYPAYRKFQTLTAHQNGFVWRRPLRAPLLVRWADVASVRTTTEHDRRALHMKGTHVELEIALRSGEHVYVTNDLDGIEQIQGYLQRGAASPVSSAWGGTPAASPWGQPPPSSGGPSASGGPPSPWGG